MSWAQLYSMCCAALTGSPFSARGDGWQSAVGSSTGSACAMSAYPWLDAAIGSDTAGELHNARSCAMYADIQDRSEVQRHWLACMETGCAQPRLFLRGSKAHLPQPSTGLIPLDGVIEASKWADTVCILTRDPMLLTNLLCSW